MKTINRLIAVLLAATMLLTFVSCDDTTTAGGSATGSSDITVSDPVFGFISEAEYDPATSVIDTSKKWTALDVDTSYYLFLTFDVTSARNNDGQSLLDVNITFDALNIMEGTIEDVSTGLIEELVFTDAVTGNVGKTTTASFKIPALSAEPKTIEMIVKLRPVDVGESHIIIGFDYDESNEYKILGSDGYTKNLKINQVQIEKPELTVTSMGLLSWKHLKNADYYKIYENGIELTDIFGEPIIINALGYSVGDDIPYNIANDIVGYHNLSIRAYSNNKNVLASSYSNSVEHEW